MSARKAITILVILIALILTGTVVVLTTVVQYFGVDSRDIITEPEMRLFERLAAQAKDSSPANPSPGQKVVGGPAGDRALEGAKAQVGGAGAREDALEVVVGKGDEAPDGQAVKELLNRLDERGWFGNASAATTASVEALAAEGETPKPRIPKIIHATWKTDTVPLRWKEVRDGCMEMHPDYEFKLWSDAASRAFIAEHYPWFLSTFDGYIYPIQRADVIRYFILHYYGGVYMDLDIGCRRNLDPLLYFQVILPATIPVGISNDLMFAEKGHPFMDLVIHNLITFDHSYGTNYPTVMFSTGPMFLSAQYGLWPKEVGEHEERQVRVLPRRWYGKNAPPTQMEDSYFDHFYGSSWHADDAGFITFLGKFGMALMYAGLLIVVLGVIRLIWSKRPILKSAPRSIGPIALPYEALPFTRPGTPGSRSGSPANGRAAAGGRGGNGGLFYLPVWLMPTGEGTSPGGGRRDVDGETNGNWSQYFSNLSFVADEPGHRYEPVPNFSRPPSPSNNSILHAPGSTHDGAFDGTPLHSIHAPRAVRPGSAPARSSADSDRSTSTATTTTPLHSTSFTPTPSSPNPPAYSALRSWGTSLFRASPFSTSPRAPLLPLSRDHSIAHSSDESSSQPSTSPLPQPKPLPASAANNFPSSAAAPGAVRPVSPAPPAYASLGAGVAGSSSSHSVGGGGGRTPSPSLADARSRSPRAGSLSTLGGFVGGAPAPSTAPKAGDRTEPQAPGPGELDPETAAGVVVDPVGVARSGASSRASSVGRRVSTGGMGIGGRVEEEVDRLLSEMAPEDYSKEQ
ncbi:hypothetical protein JCM11251_007300 [Rhodosporidiobolus azoricus]